MECLLLFGAEHFVFHLLTKNIKIKIIQNYNFAGCFLRM